MYMHVYMYVSLYIRHAKGMLGMLLLHVYIHVHIGTIGIRTQTCLWRVQWLQ